VQSGSVEQTAADLATDVHSVVPRNVSSSKTYDLWWQWRRIANAKGSGVLSHQQY